MKNLILSAQNIEKPRPINLDDVVMSSVFGLMRQTHIFAYLSPKCWIERWAMSQNIKRSMEMKSFQAIYSQTI